MQVARLEVGWRQQERHRPTMVLDAKQVIPALYEMPT